jgi:hypothetical protein
VFYAHVEYEEPGPFSYVHGPRDVDAEEAVRWARRHADTVKLRIGGTFYSAGEVPAEGLPVWPGATETLEQPATTAERESWEAEGSLNARGGDLEAVASRFAAAIELDERAADVRHWLTELGVTVTFLIRCPPAESNEVASRVLRDSWKAAEIPENSIGGSHGSSVQVRPFSGTRSDPSDAKWSEVDGPVAGVTIAAFDGPVTCAKCARPIEAGAEHTISIRVGGVTDNSFALQDLASFHEFCWCDFQHEHQLDW